MPELIPIESPPPKVSIIVPTRSGDPRCLPFVRRAARAHRIEILVAQGDWPSRQRNAAAAEAHGVYLYFLDDDSAVGPDAIDRIVNFFATHRDAAAVGGPSLPTFGSWWQTLLGELFAHPLGTYSVRHRYASKGASGPCGDEGLILANLAVRRDVFLAVGGFDERLYPNEENALLERLKGGGHTLHRDPGMTVRRPHRQSCGALVEQMFRYGRGRGRQTRHQPTPRSWLQSVQGLVLGAWAAAGWSIPSMAAMWLIYVCLLVAAAMHRALARRRWSLLGLALLFLIVPVTYGIGVVTGLIWPVQRGEHGDVIVSRPRNDSSVQHRAFDSTGDDGSM